MKKLVNNINMYWIIAFLVILIILLMPIKVRVIRNNEKNDIDLYLTKIFNIRFDIDDAIKYFLSFKENREEITVESALYNLLIMYKMRNVYKDIASLSRVSKVTMLCKLKNDDYLKNTISWVLICFFKDKIESLFSSVNDEVYNVHLNQKEDELNFEIIARFRLLFIIIAIIKNLKTIIHILKCIKKGSEKKNAKSTNS